MIYRQILVSKVAISGADRLIGNYVQVHQPLFDIDSAILRTCRATYNKAIRILYEQNSFHFSEASAAGRFSKTNLSRDVMPGHALSLKSLLHVSH